MFVNQRTADGNGLNKSIDNNLSAFFIGVAIAADGTGIIQISFAVFKAAVDVKQSQSQETVLTDVGKVEVKRQRRVFGFLVENQQRGVFARINTESRCFQFAAVNRFKIVAVVVFDNQVGGSQHKLLGNNQSGAPFAVAVGNADDGGSYFIEVFRRQLIVRITVDDAERVAAGKESLFGSFAPF